MPVDKVKTYIPAAVGCDICASEEVWTQAYADANIPGSSWAYLCKSHFERFGCQLGLGKGQELIVGDRPIEEMDGHDEIVRAVADALGVSEDEIDW